MKTPSDDGLVMLGTYGAIVFVVILFIGTHYWFEDRRQERIVRLAELMIQAATQEARDAIDTARKGLEK